MTNRLQNLQKLISDAEIIDVHGNADFGPIPPRKVVNEGVLKAAFGYSGGHTQFLILREHQLIRRDWSLTVKGLKYLRALSCYNAALAEISEGCT